MKKRWVIAAVAVAFVVGVSPSLFVLSPMPNVGTPPDEARRVRHPDGYSIVFPEKMVGVIDPGLPGITSRAESGRSRYYPSMSIRRLHGDELAQPRESDGSSMQQFQGRPAQIEVRPQGKYYAWRARFERHERWFELSLLLPGRAHEYSMMPPPEWSPYLESFRFDLPSTRPAASAPATERQ